MPELSAITREVRDSLKGTHLARYSSVVCVGMAQGVFPETIRERSDLPIVIYDPRLPRNARVNDWRGVTAIRDIPALRLALRDLHRHDDREPLVLHCDTADGEITEEVDRVVRAWDEVSVGCVMEQRSARLTTLHRTTVFLGTVPHLADRAPINHVKGCLAGIPAICVGGGPSVNRAIDAIRAAQGRALIVAVNTSAPSLVAAGIRPDVVVTCESKDIIKTMADVSDSVLVPGLHVHPDTWSVPCRRLAPAMSAEGIFGEWLCRTLRAESIHIGGSSGTLSAGVAAHLGCDPIILVGHDCCADAKTGMLYADKAQWAGTRIDLKDGEAFIHRSEAKFAADETVCPGRDPDYREPATEVPSWDGEGTVMCFGAYDSLRQWWEESAIQPPFRDRTLINASAGGARLYGWEPKRLADVPLGDPCDPQGRLVEALDDAKTIDRGTLRTAIASERDGTRYVRELAEKGARLARELREVQTRMAEADPDATLLESYSWGEFESDRLHGDKEPIFDRMAVLLDDIRLGAESLDGLLSSVQDGIS